MRTLSHSTAAKPTAISGPSGGLLQRKCACDGPLEASGNCGKCRQRRLDTQRNAFVSASDLVPSLEHEVLRAPGQPLDDETRSFGKWGGHDLSQVPLRTGGNVAGWGRAVVRYVAVPDSNRRVSFNLAAEGHPQLPANTPAWAEDGRIYIGPAGTWMPPVELCRVLRHEAFHSMQQQTAPRDESAAARLHAEILGSRFERGVQVPTARDLMSPVPRLLGYPPQPRSPWDRVWIGKSGLVGEVTAEGVAVRIFVPYGDIGIEGRQGYRSYECGEHHSSLESLVNKMKDVALKTAWLNEKIPAGARAQRVALVAIHGGSAASAYRMANGHGMILLSADEFGRGAWQETIAHEGAHAIFEYHSVHLDPATRTPDPLALRIADLYVKLGETKRVAEPSAKFDPANPPALEILEGPAERPTERPAGILMVMDTLWAGSGGHPWDSVDEFFASAYAGFLQEPEPLRQIINHYQKADPKIGPLATELLELLERVGDPNSLSKVQPPADATPGESALKAITPVLDFSDKDGYLGWLIDPSKMRGPERIDCSIPHQSSSQEDSPPLEVREIVGPPQEPIENLLNRVTAPQTEP
jgi:hypothetical protein